MTALTGCAAAPQGAGVNRPVGRNYPNDVLTRFVLGQTNLEDAESLLGAPMRQSSVHGTAKLTPTQTVSGTPLTFTMLNYYYLPNGNGRPISQHPYKNLTCAFADGRLIGYDTASTMPGDILPPIDESRLKSLHQGMTTRAEAIALIGRPTGQVLHVFGSDSGTSEISYGSTTVNNGTVDARILKVFFDKVGTVSSYSVTENSYPTNGMPLLQPQQAAPSNAQAPRTP